MKLLPAISIALLTFAATTAHAQAPAPSSPAAGVPPAHTCVKPEHPGNLGSDTRKRMWQRDATAFLECLKKFAGSEREAAELHLKLANSTIDEYNASVKEFEDEAKKK